MLSIGIFLLKNTGEIHASSTCTITAEPQIPIVLHIERYKERIVPFLLMDPILQIRFYLNRSEFHRNTAKSTITDNPSLGYQELLRSIHTFTLLEKPIRSITNPKDIPYDEIWKSISDTNLRVKEYQNLYGHTCNTEFETLSEFLARDEKTLKKIYYESLLVSTKEIYSEK